MPAPPADRWSAPRSETELLQFRPPSHQDGVFPRRLLLPGERVLFETRPVSMAWNRWLYALLLFLFVSDLIVTSAAIIVAAANNPASNAVAIVFALLGGIGIVLWGGILALLYRSRRSTAYALTQRRVLAVAGFWSSRFQFLDRSQITRMWSPDGQGRWIAFEAPSSVQAGARGAGLVDWKDVPWGPRTMAFVQGAFALEARLDATDAAAQHRRTVILTDRVVCEYCGNLVQVAEGEEPPRTCPRCSAPLPVPTLAAGAPPARAPAGDRHLVPALRPAVQLARDAVEWYRTVPVLWALFMGSVAFLAFSWVEGVPSGSAIFSGLVLAVFTAAIVGTVLWIQAVRKWSTVVVTARRALPTGSETATRLLPKLRRGRVVAWAAMVASVVLWPVSLVALSLEAQLYPGGPASSVDAFVTIAPWMVGATAAAVIGQWPLVAGGALLASGSEIPAIERDLRWGRQVAAAGLLVGFGFPMAMLLTLFANLPPTTFVVLTLLTEAGPIAVFGATFRTSRGLAAWSDLADRVIVPELDRGTVRAVGDVSALGAPAPAPTLRRALVTSPWTRVAALILVVVAVLSVVSGLGWLTPPLNAVTATVHLPPPPPPPPKVIIPNGTVWKLPADYYEYQRFTLSQNATLTGSFSSDHNVYVLVLSYYEFWNWYDSGQPTGGARFNSGNVTSAQFYLPIAPSTDWYVIAENLSPTQGANVTWTTECVLDYSG
jgi:hypothetical protein